MVRRQEAEKSPRRLGANGLTFAEFTERSCRCTPPEEVTDLINELLMDVHELQASTSMSINPIDSFTKSEVTTSKFPTFNKSVSKCEATVPIKKQKNRMNQSTKSQIDPTEASRNSFTTEVIELTEIKMDSIQPTEERGDESKLQPSPSPGFNNSTTSPPLSTLPLKKRKIILPSDEDSSEGSSLQPPAAIQDQPKRKKQNATSVSLEGDRLLVNGEEIPYNRNMVRSFASVDRTPEEQRRRMLNNLRSRASRARAKLGETRKYVRKNK